MHDLGTTATAVFFVIAGGPTNLRVQKGCTPPRRRYYPRPLLLTHTHFSRGEQLSEVRDSHRDLEADFAKVVEERDQLYDNFEEAVRAIQQKSDFRWV